MIKIYKHYYYIRNGHQWCKKNFGPFFDFQSIKKLYQFEFRTNFRLQIFVRSISKRFLKQTGEAIQAVDKKCVEMSIWRPNTGFVIIVITFAHITLVSNNVAGIPPYNSTFSPLPPNIELERLPEIHKLSNSMKFDSLNNELESVNYII